MKAPRFWDANLDPQSRQAAPITRKILTPIAKIYENIVARKIAQTTPYECGVPVICVGNLTTGGSGKTPLVRKIRNDLARRGIRVASLSRGYGGKAKGPLKVENLSHLATEVGDEPLMLSQTGEAWIGANRAKAAQAMVDNDIELIVMDDGHQNPSLLKTVSLVVIDSENPFGNGFIIPKGPLRESIESGLSRANAIVLTGAGSVPKQLAHSNLPVIRSKIVATAPPTSNIYVSFAGIGRPEKFFDTLSEIKVNVADAVPFPDHHKFSKNDLNYLRKLAEQYQAKLITTEKDYVRLPDDIKDEVEVLQITPEIENPSLLETVLEPVLEKFK